MLGCCKGEKVGAAVVYTIFGYLVVLQVEKGCFGCCSVSLDCLSLICVERFKLSVFQVEECFFQCCQVFYWIFWV